MTEIWNLSTLCRCCHSDGCFKKLNLPYESEDSVEIYETMLVEVLGIKVLQPIVEQASNMICDNCIKRLQDASQFKRQVLACEQKFKVYCFNEQFPIGGVPFETVKLEIEPHEVEDYDVHMEDDDHRDDELQKEDGLEDSPPMKEEETKKQTRFEDDSSIDEEFPNTSRSSIHETSTILDGSFFEIIQDNNEVNVAALCKKCLPKRVEIKGNRNSTSNFKGHLKRKHGNGAVLEYEAYKKTKRSRFVRFSNTSVEPLPHNQDKTNVDLSTQEDFDRDFVYYFVSSMIRLTSVKDFCFRQLMERSNPYLQIMDRRLLGMKITGFFIKELRLIKQQLEEVSHVCTTVDIWPGRRTSFLGVTAHWLDPETLKRTSRALDCRRLKDIQNYDKIYEFLQEIESIFKIRNTFISTCVINNCSTLVKAFESFGVDLDNILSGQANGLSCDVESQSDIDISDNDITENHDHLTVKYLKNHLALHLRCASHTLILCAIDANKVLENQDTELSTIHCRTLEKCNRLWKASRMLPSGQIMREHLGYSLTIPNETKWRSLYEALSEILALKDKSASLHKNLKLKNNLLKSEFVYINEYLTCTQPIVDALEILESENGTYYGILLPTILTLKKKIVRLREGNSFQYCNHLTEAYLSSVQTRFENFLTISNSQAENAALASLTHPKYKTLKWASLVGHSQFMRIKNLLVEELSKYIKPTINSKPQTPNRSKEDEYFELDSSSDSESVDSDSMLKAELIVSHYFAEKNKDLSLLNDHMEIRKLFIKYNTPLPSSASVQRMFSHEIMANCPRINFIGEMFERRVVLKVNLDYKEAM